MAMIQRETVKMLCTIQFWRMAILWSMSLLYSYFILLGDALGYSRAPSSGDPPPGRSPPVCVITGATSGLGAEAAKVLAGKGYYVVLAGRSHQSLDETMKWIRRHDSSASLKAFVVDLSSIHSIIQFKCSIEDWLLKSNMHLSLQLLINNAGILATSSRATPDGYDLMMETNYLSTFVLTSLLWPFLKNSRVPSRVVNVTSFTHRCVSKAPVTINHHLECFSNLENYPLAHRYEYSKFWLVLFTYELHRRFCLLDLSPNITVLAADPGAVETNIMRELPKQLSQLAYAGLRFFHLLQAPKDGVASIIDAALAPPDVSGEYFFGGGGRRVRSSTLSYNTKLAKELWDGSLAAFHKAISEVKHGENGEKILLFGEPLDMQHSKYIQQDE